MPEFEWDEHNVAHIAVHGVTPEDVEEALGDPNRKEFVAYDTQTERRRAYVGETATGRLLFVVLTQRGEKLRVVTARDAKRTERRLFREIDNGAGDHG